MNQVPNFLIVGAMKAATTSFGSDLNQHPDIYVAPRELHFFNAEKNYAKGVQYYKEFFQDREEKTVGEKTPSYSYHEDVPARIASDFPKMKLIWILRDPIQRAYSHYQFFVQQGMERETFKGAIQRELRGENIKYFMNYLDRSIYIKQINRYLNFFPISQMHFILFDDYINKTLKVLKETCSFLGTNTDFTFTVRPSEKNVTRIPLSRDFQFLLRKGIQNIGKGKYILKKLQQWNLHKTIGYPPLPADLTEELAKFFEPYNEELKMKIGMDFNNKKSWR